MKIEKLLILYFIRISIMQKWWRDHMPFTPSFNVMLSDQHNERWSKRKGNTSNLRPKTAPTGLVEARRRDGRWNESACLPPVRLFPCSSCSCWPASAYAPIREREQVVIVPTRNNKGTTRSWIDAEKNLHASSSSEWEYLTLKITLNEQSERENP